ncbi:MAG TPA: TIGR03936 family radical SAM-associated protein [Anaerolineaceae bacterium]
MRIRITFSKTDAMRFTGHLDLYRTWERTLRRAGLPLAYSQGFNPHPRINLAAALPLGFTSQGDILDVGLEQELTAPDIESALRQAAPPGIRIEQVQVIDDHLPTLQAVLQASEFTITFLEPFPELDARLAELLQAETLPRERRGKSYDLRRLVLELRRLPDDEQGHSRLFARLTAREGATGRPEEVVAALGTVPEQTRVHRSRLVFTE